MIIRGKRLRSVEVLRIEPGDRIIVEYEGRLTSAEAADISAQLKRLFPDQPVQVVVLSGGASLKVVRGA